VEPILNPILVAAFYGETMGSFALIGAGVVVAGVVGYNVLKVKQHETCNIKGEETNDLL